MDYRRRLTGLQTKMEEQGYDLIVYGPGPCYQYLTGANTEWRNGRDLLHPEDNVFIPRKGEPIVTLATGSNPVNGTWIKDVRILEKDQKYRDLVKSVVSDIGVGMGKVAVSDYCWGSTVLAVYRSCGQNLFIQSPDKLLDNQRMIKENEEIQKLRKAAEVTDNAMGLVLPRVVEGLNQKNLVIMIEMMGRGLGATSPSFGITGGYVKTGTIPSDDPFIYPKEAGLSRGCSIAFDVGFVVDGYCSDWGRSFYYGTPRKEILEAYQALQLSVVMMADEIGKTVLRTSDIYPHIERTLDQYGFGNYLRARLKTGVVGHQIGVEVHEDPWLKPEPSQPLINDMVFCVEPKLWYKGDYYLRVEDMIHIKNGKAEFLTRFPRDQFQL